MSDTSGHVPFEQIVDLVEGRLTPERRAALQAHTAGCLRCSADIAWLDRTLRLMRADTSEGAPPETIERIRRMFRSRPGAHLGLRHHVRPVLRFDSARQPQAAGVRSGLSTERQLIYDVGTFDLELRIVRTGTGWSVAGQLLGPELSGTAHLHGPRGSATAELSELSEFALSPLPSGRYSLSLRLEALEVDIPELDLGV